MAGWALRGQDTNCRISHPAVGARLSRSGPPRPSPSHTKPPKLHGRRRRGGRLPRWRMRRRLAPRPLPENRRRQFLSESRNSRYGESRARSAAYRRAARRGRDEAKIGDNAIPLRLADNPLISLETAKEKVWKSLEKFGKAWNFLGISLEKFGNPWKSWRRGDGIFNPSLGRRRLASEARAARRGGRKSCLRGKSPGGLWIEV